MQTSNANDIVQILILRCWSISLRWSHINYILTFASENALKYWLVADFFQTIFANFERFSVTMTKN